MSTHRPIGQEESEVATALGACAAELAHTTFVKGFPPASTRASVIRDAAFAFDLDVLSQIVRLPGVNAIVVNRGRLSDSVARDLEHPLAILARGESIVVRHAEAHSLRIASLTTSVARAIGGLGHAQLFVTPAGARSFGWHYDDEDVLILQTGGAKDYWFRENTRPSAQREPTDAARFARINDERSATYTTMLEPGDVLFLPKHVWHVATARTTSWSISIGVRRA